MLERKGSDEQIKLSFVEGWSTKKREENMHLMLFSIVLHNLQAHKDRFLTLGLMMKILPLGMPTLR
jgi:hypothetical protein